MGWLYMDYKSLTKWDAHPSACDEQRPILLSDRPVLSFHLERSAKTSCVQIKYNTKK